MSNLDNEKFTLVRFEEYFFFFDKNILFPVKLLKNSKNFEFDFYHKGFIYGKRKVGEDKT
jgi:hypothetical protein